MDKIKQRNEIDAAFTWDLTDIYEAEEDFLKDSQILTGEIDELAGYQGRLAASAAVLLQALECYSRVSERFEKVYVYANQKLHEDMGNSRSQQVSGEVDVIRNRFQTESSFLVPEILAIPEQQLQQFISQEQRLEFYRRFLDNIQRQKQHTLDPDTEAILAKAEEMAKAPSGIYSMFNNADIKFQPVHDSDGNELPLTQGKYGIYMESGDRRLRREAFEQLYAGYEGYKHTLAAVYDANLKQAAFYADVRNYDSALEASLDGGNIPVSVYENLLAAVHDNIGLLHRYMGIRKKRMKLDELHMYDLYVPMVARPDSKIPFDEAKQIVKEGLRPLGEEYLQLLEQGYSNRWIDVYENEGKRTGAYSWGAYGSHPYVLLNYQGNLNHVFTLAHEMGHALHSWYSDHHQEYLYAGYRIFVAEVASTCNEALLIHYLMDKTSDKTEKAYLINYFLEQFRTTLFRQAMFAEFEKVTHETVAKGGVLNAEVLGQIYYELNKTYFGEALTADEQIQYEWSRIPHFYTPFYVYQYATGFSAAIAISSKILAGDREVLEGYFKFLSSGSSQDPIDLLKLAGVDMTTAEPVDNALKVFAEYLDKFEELLD